MNRLARIGQRVGRRALRVPPAPPAPWSSPFVRIQKLERQLAEQEGRLDLLYLVGSGLLCTGCLLVLHKKKDRMYG